MAHYKKLLGEKCYLSPIADEDGNNWARWMNDTEVTLPLGDEFYQVLGVAKTQEMVKESQLRGDKAFTIVDRETDRALGDRYYDAVLMDILSHEYESIYIKKALAEL
jgi:hypothetical protein